MTVPGSRPPPHPGAPLGCGRRQEIVRGILDDVRVPRRKTPQDSG
ncbi:hypothetical protein QJS66_08125 [Kocuria rhizophila]|nr:hypothetical protein QJS66_08125 [Kocuria rhizophila]